MDRRMLWSPSAQRIEAATMTRFLRRMSGRHGVELDYHALHRWSIDNLETFWRELWTFCGVVGDGPGDRTVVDRDQMPGARYFPDARICFAENLLQASLTASTNGDALVFRGEDKSM